jgi:hypothetical protein
MVQIHIFLTSALVRGEWPASRPGRVTPWEITRSAHWRGGLVGPHSRSGPHGEMRIVVLTGNRTPASRPSSPSAVSIPTALPQHSDVYITFNITSVAPRLRLALSKGPNRVSAAFHLIDGNRPSL